MERADVDRWLQAYIDAWKSYDRERILALFAEDIECRYEPYSEPVRGAAAVAASWVADDRIDEPGTYDAAYKAIAVDGEVAVATGSSTYAHPDGSIRAVYDNCFVMRFDDEGRCREFTEWYMKRPKTD
jgi:ketosteroid isomerase-like protein